MNSILTSVKKTLGLVEEYEVFDMNIIMLINAVFSILREMGVGPVEGFSISSADDVWTDFLDEGPLLNLVKPYVSFKVWLMFDTNQASGVAEAIKSQINDLEWRISTEVNPEDTYE